MAIQADMIEPTSPSVRSLTNGQWDMIDRLANFPAERRKFSGRIDPSIYVDQDRFARERSRVFRRLPVLIGPSAMLPQPGMAVTHEETGLPLLLTRDASGRLRVMLNACRHRGAQLLASTEAVAKARLVCPYHAWTYKLDGSLLAAPMSETFECLDKSQLGLIEFPATESGGLIHAILDPQATPDFSTLEPVKADFEAFSFASHQLFQRRVHTVSANWKFIMDAFQEIYHVQVLHATTVGKMFANAVTTEDFLEPHIRFATARKGFADLERNAEIGRVRSLVTFSYTVFPATIVVVSPTYVNILVCHPQSPEQTLVEDFMLIPHQPETDEQRNHWLRSWELLDGGVYSKEDFQAAEWQHKGVASGLLGNTLLGGLEYPVAVFHRSLDNALAD